MTAAAKCRKGIGRHARCTLGALDHDSKQHAANTTQDHDVWGLGGGKAVNEQPEKKPPCVCELYPEPPVLPRTTSRQSQSCRDA